MEIKIRKIIPDDAEQIKQVTEQTDTESTFTLYKPGERKNTVEEQRKKIEGFLSKPNQMIFVALDGDKIIGYLTILGGSYEMTKRTATIIIGIIQSYTSKGIGTKLFQIMEEWAKSVGLHRLELKVDDGNEKGIGLYKKMGFVVEARTKDSTFVDGKYRDAFVMAKII